MNTRSPLLTTLFALSLGWLGWQELAPAVHAQQAQPQSLVPVNPISEGRALLEDELNTIEVIERYGPSVVTVNVTVQGQRMDPFSDLPMDQLPPMFRDLLPQLRQPQQPPAQQGTGSGFVIDGEGRIVTNYHVVRGALRRGEVEPLEGATIAVIFPDRPDDELLVRVIGANPDYDLALLELVDANDLPDVLPIPIADSDEVRVGQKVIAIGNPFGLRSTVTSGIVSAIGREGAALNIPMIQTDAAINRGNSGGPLLNSRGELVGINTAILAGAGGGFVGVGLAVPSNFLFESLAALEEGGVLGLAQTRPRIGVGLVEIPMRDYPESVRQHLRLPETGVMIQFVEPGSPADRAGLRGTGDLAVSVGNRTFAAGGDVITAVDGENVSTLTQLQNLVFSRSPGDTVTLSVVREGEELEIDVTLEVIRPQGSN